MWVAVVSTLAAAAGEMLSLASQHKGGGGATGTGTGALPRMAMCCMGRSSREACHTLIQHVGTRRALHGTAAVAAAAAMVAAAEAAAVAA